MYCMLFIVSSFPLRCSMCNGVSCSVCVFFLVSWFVLWSRNHLFENVLKGKWVDDVTGYKLGGKFPVRCWWHISFLSFSFFVVERHFHFTATVTHTSSLHCFQELLFEHSVMQLALLPQHAFDSTKCAARWLLSPLLMHQNSIWAATQRLGWLLHFQLTTLNHKILGKDLRNVFLQLLQCFSSKTEFALHVENHMLVCVILSPVQIC